MHGLSLRWSRSGSQAASGLWIVIAAVCYLPTDAARSIPAPTVDVQSTVGASSDGVQLLAAQIRADGDITPVWRYVGEAGVGYRPGSGEDYSAASKSPVEDAFGAAYPYTGRPVLLEDYVERTLSSGAYSGAVRIGRFRPPFGIYNESDYAYAGFIRAPLIRYYTNWALSNYWFDTGADVVFGRPFLQLELSGGTPGEDVERRRNRVDTVARLQGYAGALIAGVSHIVTDPPEEYSFDRGRSEFSGVDFRWMRAGLQLRGEWLAGHQGSGTYTQGWYVDTLMHEPALERVTWVARYEELRYSAGSHSANLSRLTLGGRLVLTPSIAAQLNLIQHSLVDPAADSPGDVAADFTLTYRFRV